MTDFVLSFDADADRRERWMGSATRRFAPVARRAGGGFRHGDFALEWTCPLEAPISVLDSDQAFALVLGEAIDEHGVRVDGNRLRKAWSTGRPTLASWAGYHLAILLDKKERTLLVGSDVLGCFPIHHLVHEGATIAASAPDLLLGQPETDMTLDLEGLAGILHTNGLVGGRTLWRGIRRLPADRALGVSNGRERHVARVGIPWMESTPDLRRADIAAQAGILGESAADAARSMFPSPASTGLLLSGGLDSRLVTGYLRENRISASTYTFGSSSDLESLIARQVAGFLGWRHMLVEEPLQRFHETARWSVTREGLSGGLLMPFGALLVEEDLSPPFPARTITGIQLEPVFGGLFLEDREDIHNTGLRPDVFHSLGPGASLVDAHRSMLDILRHEQEALPGEADQRGWLQDLHQHYRFQLGNILWRLSQSTWPVPLSLSPGLLSIRRALPFLPEPFGARSIQKKLVVDRFPDLAAIPFDANSFQWYVLRTTHRTLWRELFLRIHRKIGVRLGRETRYYHRLSDLRNPHWERIRRLAEPGRRALEDLLSAEPLRSFLPPPSVSIPNLADPFAASEGHRILLGVMLHLQACDSPIQGTFPRPLSRESEVRP